MSAKPSRYNLKPYRLIYWPLLLPVALLLALYNRIAPVPFKLYALRVDRIGQMAGNQEELCCQLDLGLFPKEFRVFIHRDRPSNKALLEMQKRILPIHNTFLPLFDVCHKLGGLGISSTKLLQYLGQDWEQHVTVTPQHLSFSKAEIAEAHQQCTELGVDPEKPFVPVLARDNSYLKHIGEPTDLDSYRNDDINTYQQGIEYIADYWKVVRMGSVVNKKLKTDHPNFLDYSASGKRTELLDVYFSAQCTFFMSCGTGLDAITSCCFRRPVLYVNFIAPSCAPILKPGSILIPKKYWHTKEKRYLSLTELIHSPIGDMILPSELTPLGIVVHDNTPEEILAVSKEMKARIDGTWVETPEDQKRQEAFWEHYMNVPKQFKKAPLEYRCMGLIGADFLRKNPNWIE